MTRSYSDDELQALARIPKKVTNPGARWLMKPRETPMHEQRRLHATGTAEDGRDLCFRVYQ